MSILVINAGSSSIKFGLFDIEARQALASGLVDWAADPSRADLTLRIDGAPNANLRIEAPDYRAAVGHVLQALRERNLATPTGPRAITVIGQRVVHGGATFREPARIDSRVKAAIAELAELAPLHNGPALRAIEAVASALPDVPQVAVFDTAFYASLAPSAKIYALPYEWYTDWGVQRFGFHGISHAYCAGRAAEMLGRHALRLVSCHLGNGCSATAVRDGVAVATTMGFTPLEGLVMGTRSGSVDPGILLYAQRHRGLDPDALDDALQHRSGLLGISGVSSDLRQVEAAAKEGNTRAQLALEIYAASVRSAIGAFAVTLGGVDALVFTAGAGENSASLRVEICRGLECLGLRLDAKRNAACAPDEDVASADSPARILVLHTREDLMIAREVCRLKSPRSRRENPR